jgi:aldose 1-epimerase
METDTVAGGAEVVRLRDSVNGVDVSVMPAFGNAAVAMKIHGKDILYFPSIEESQGERKMGGIPILAPWANRLDHSGFWAGGQEHVLRTDTGNLKLDSNGLPIHGLLWKQKWDVSRIVADETSASATSLFDFSKHPDLMAQWPFAHEYEMTYRLADGVLETRITVTNHSVDPMPLSLGFHPFIRIPEVPRDQWKATIPARLHVVTDTRLIPTGEFKPVKPPTSLLLAGRTFDDGFADLVRDGKGFATFSIEADRRKVEVVFGPKYEVAIVWVPIRPDGDIPNFVCFEPMTGVTNAINLHQAGKYPSLQMIPPGQQWTESFWIRVSG